MQRLRETFKFIYGISQDRLTALLKHFLEHGLSLRQKKRGRRKYNTKALSPEDVERVVHFICHFAEDHALVLPGRAPGFKRSDIRILPSSQTKMAIWRHYRQIAIACGHRAVSKSSFLRLWQQHVPFIVIERHMTDLCWQCKQGNEIIRHTANLPEPEKIRVLGDQMQHLHIVEEEQTFFLHLAGCLC